MAVWYSDHFGADGDNDTSLLIPAGRLAPWQKSGKFRIARAKVVGMPLITEVVRMFSLKSSDRLFSLVLFASGGTAGAADVGLYLAGGAHNGASVDVDLFASATTGASTIDGTDMFDESTNLIATDRGRALWELADKGAGTYTEDPEVDFDVCLTVTTSFTTADATLILQAEYIPGAGG